MSLLEQNRVACVLLDKKREPDGEGGYITTWEDGVKFMAAISFDNSMQARTAEKQGVSSFYTVTTEKNFMLEYHDVFRRLYDEKIFRVTSDGDDKATPASSTLNMRQVSAEEWRLTV